MKEEKLLTVREVASVLGASEKEIIDLAESGVLPAYKVGGVYLRFKKEQVMEFRKNNHAFSSRHKKRSEHSVKDRLHDFFYFHDFYLLATAVILILLFIIFRG
jgi:excisionase family DNA binding protein